jgi:protocatechuate 3,4-dioxygenase, alpha subunit
VTLPRTPSQTVGPYYVIGLCRRPDDVLDLAGVELRGQLLDGRGDPIGDGMVEVWDAGSSRWGRSGTDADGRFRFLVPRDSVVLEAYVFARGLLRHQRTRIYLRDIGDEVLSSLAGGERSTLLAQLDGEGFRFDIHMQGESATVFFEH